MREAMTLGTPMVQRVLNRLFHGTHESGQAADVRRVVLRPGATPAPASGGHTHEHHHHPREPIAVLYLAMLFGLWWANAMDLALTLAWTGDVGWGAEGNAIMRAIAGAGGSLGFAVYKLMLMTLVVLMLWWLYLKVEDWGFHARTARDQVRSKGARVVVFLLTGCLTGFYGLVVVNNLHVMGYV